MPVAPSRSALRPLTVSQVSLDGGFWGVRQRLNRDTILQHADSWMTRLGWVQNLLDAAGSDEYEHRGREFADSEVYKLVEAMSWALKAEHDEELSARLDELVATIEGAQEPDGYLHTRYGRPWQPQRYSDLMWGHELYCFGHLIQAAVAHRRATGEDRLLRVATRLADHVCVEFGPAGREAICGHPEIEVALVELSRLTGDVRYLNQASVFLERRGTGLLPLFEFGREYWQDATSIRDTEVLHGHAVRALYLASGAVDAAVETDDAVLLATLERQWANTVARRTYLTGGMGSHHMDEAFGEDFVLPPDRSYCETCAGVASIMLSWRLLLATGQAHYADLIERTLYNVVATSPSEDGTAFFYANTLHQRSAHGQPAKNAEGVTIRGGAAGRQEWYEVSCCPPNVARTLASLGAYIATTDPEGIQVHQYAAGEIRADLEEGAAVLRVDTTYPVEGSVAITVLEAPSEGFTLRLRIPAWANGATLASDDVPADATPGSYASVKATRGARVVLELPLDVRTTLPDGRIDGIRGTVAFERGPEVLALESVDLPDGWILDEARVALPVTLGVSKQPAVRLRRTRAVDTSWPYGAPQVEHAETFSVPLVRYHSWAERGPSTMRVWIPLAD